ncbi:MAG: carbohydrate kinase family protein [Chloroflexi bacterium]|nr:carbohydrate kinase family protein [Chloroflexota bacterium]
MNILITGSVAYDYLMTFPGQFKDHILADQLDSISLSFLVDSLVRRRGGVAANIAFNLALLGVRSRIMATVGKDFDTDRTWLEDIGVDTSSLKVIEDKFTASFFATTDETNAQMASFYPGAMEHAAEQSLHEFERQKPDLVVVSPNDPGAMDKYIAECKEMRIPYLYDPSQQIVRVEGDVLRDGIEGAKALFVNEYEFGMIQKKTGMNKTDILSNVGFLVITAGENGATISVEDEEIRVPAVKTTQIKDPTGSGDAFRGGFLTGYSRGWDWETCGRTGALTATYCLEQDGPQGHTFTRQEFVSRYREHFDDNSVLDALIEK